MRAPVAWSVAAFLVLVFLLSPGSQALAQDATDGGMATTVFDWLRSEEGGVRWAVNIGKVVGVLIALKLFAVLVARVARKVLSDGQSQDL